MGLARITEPHDPNAGSRRSEPPPIARDPVHAPAGQYHDALTGQVPTVPPRQRLDRDLVADSLDQHDDGGVLRPDQPQRGGLSRRRWPAHVSGQQIFAVLRAHAVHFHPCERPAPANFHPGFFTGYTFELLN